MQWWACSILNNHVYEAVTVLYLSLGYVILVGFDWFDLSTYAFVGWKLFAFGVLYDALLGGI